MIKRVTIADDHELMLEGICALLDRSGRCDVVATAGDGDTAIQQIETQQPDLAIVDASMPGKSGIEVIAAASLLSEGTDFILFSMFDHVHLIAEAASAGAAACVSKNDAATDLLKAIEAVEQGDFFVSRSLSEDWNRLQETEPFVPLSPRESEVMQSVVEGASNKEIASLLNLSVRTVDHHRERLMKKIGARNAADIVRYAAKRGEV